MRRMLAIIIVACGLEARAEVPEPTLLPTMPTANMQLSWGDFSGMLEVLYRDALREQMALYSKEEAPPWDWTFSSAVYRADATKPGSVAVHATLEFQVFSKGWTKVPVIGDNIGLVEARLNGEEVGLAREAGEFWLLRDAPGTHTLDLKFVVPAPLSQGWAGFSFRVQPAPIMRMELALAEGFQIVDAGAAADWRIESAGSARVAHLIFRPAEELQVRWSHPAPPVPKEPEVPPRFAAETETLLTFRDEHLHARTTLHLEMLRGTANVFQVALPVEAKLLDVVGEGAMWQAEERDGTQVLLLRVNHEVGKNYEAVIEYELPVDAERAQLAAPRLLLPDAERQTGHIAISTATTASVEAHAEAGALRMDASDLPERLRAASAHMILHAFRYTRPEYVLGLSIERFEDVAVRVASVEEAQITSIVTEQNLIVHRAVYRVRNTIKQFMRLDPGPDAEVWSARVGGRPVTPARDEEDHAILLPLLKAGHGGAQPPDFLVELVYSTPGSHPTGLRHTLELQAPGIDILTNAVLWEVFLPEDRALRASTGDLRRRPHAATLQPERGEMVGTMTGQAFRMREGIERFLITDINNPAASALAQSKTYSESQAAPASQVDARLAGVLPISLNLPEVGRPEQFERAYVLQDQALRLSITTHPSRLWGLARGALGVLIVLAGLAVAGLLWKWRRQAALRSHAAATGITLGVTGLLWWAFLPGFPGLYLAFAAGLAAPILLRALQQTTANQEAARDESHKPAVD